MASAKRICEFIKCANCGKENVVLYNEEDRYFLECLSCGTIWDSEIIG